MHRLSGGRRREIAARRQTDPEFDVLAHVRSRAPMWYPDLGERPVLVEPVGTLHRTGARIDFVAVSAGATHHEIAVKRYERPSSQSDESRPRLGMVGDREAKPAAEYQALVELRAALEGSAITARGVTPLEFVADHRTLFIERFPGRNAREVLTSPRAISLDVMAAGGASLAVAHRTMQREPQSRLATNDDISRTFEELCRFVDSMAPDHKIVDRTTAWWRAHPMVGRPERGACHADCAPRNLLFDRTGTVAWIDGLFRSEAPVHQDLALFVTSCRFTERRNPSTRWFGRATAAELSKAFVDGYRSQAHVSAEWLRRFEILVSLDRLGAVLNRRRHWRSRAVQLLVEAELRSLTDNDD